MGKRIIISRTDSIGDVILTLPLAVALKKQDPSHHILFLGRGYTKAVIEACPAVDQFVDVAALHNVDDWRSLQADSIIHVFPKSELAWMAKKAGIPQRVGTSHRLYHWFTCNDRLNLGRKNSALHEAQLNVKLGTPLGLKSDFSLEEIRQMELLKSPPRSKKVEALLVPGKVNVILHPKSRGSAREWGLGNYTALISMLPKEKFHIMVSGTKEEGDSFRNWISRESVTDITGALSLSEFMELISGADALVAASTGPLHIASALGIHAYGIYAPIRPMHPGRWGPIGKKSRAYVIEKDCSDCRRSGNCTCIQQVEASTIASDLMKLTS